MVSDNFLVKAAYGLATYSRIQDGSRGTCTRLLLGVVVTRALFDLPDRSHLADQPGQVLAKYPAESRKNVALFGKLDNAESRWSLYQAGVSLLLRDRTEPLKLLRQSLQWQRLCICQ